MKDQIRNDRTTDLGVVRINNEAISAIASIAAMDVKGVRKMGGRPKRGIFEIFSRRGGGAGVKIEMKDSEVRLSIAIVVDYGVAIPRIADEVQQCVKHSVEKMTGLVLSEVDVIVEGVHAPAAPEGLSKSSKG